LFDEQGRIVLTPQISIDNFDAHAKAAAINSPRSVEDCRRQGILPKDLFFVSKDEYAKIFAAERLDDYNMQIRFDHMEKRRQEKVRIVVEERQKLLEMEKAGIDPFATSGNFKGTAKGTAAGLLSKEAALIEKMKKNQRKEIEQMMQYELELQSIREKNEEKARKQAEKEAKRLQDVESKKKEAEEKRLKDEADKKKKIEEVEAARLKLEQERFTKEQLKEDEAKKAEADRRDNARKAEEAQKKKQEEFRMKTEKILEEQRQEVEQRKKSMEMKDQERKKKLEEERSIKAQQLKAKQEEHKAKIDETKHKNEHLAVQRKQKYDEKEKAAEEKKKMFEAKKEEAHLKNQEKFEKKEMNLQKARSASQATLIKKKEDYFEKMTKNEEKKKIQEADLKRELEEKKRLEQENQRKREEITKANKEGFETKKNTLVHKAQEKDSKLQTVKDRKEAERMLQKNLEQIKKLDKLESVRRNERKKDWERNRLFQKILTDNEKIGQMKSEKKQLLHEKADIKAKIDRDREELARKFQLVKEGKMDPNSLVGGTGSAGSEKGTANEAGSMNARTTAQKRKINTSVSPTKKNDLNASGEAQKSTNAFNRTSELPKAAQPPKPKPPQASKNATGKTAFETKPGETFEDALIRLKDIQGREMLRVLDEESKAENNRESELLVVTDLVERKRLAKIHGVQKARAKERINQIMTRHEQEAEELRQKQRS